MSYKVTCLISQQVQPVLGIHEWTVHWSTQQVNSSVLTVQVLSYKDKQVKEQTICIFDKFSNSCCLHMETSDMAYLFIN